MNIIFYYAIDGDDIGKQLEGYALRNDILSISLLSDQVKAALKTIEDHFTKKGGHVIFCEGDSLLASSEEQIDIPKSLLIHGSISFSAGVGRSTSMALLALKKAKGLGKKRVEMLMRELE